MCIRDSTSFHTEDEVHLTLSEMDYDSVKIILDFAYGGEAKIPRTNVETVCEVANELRVKYLKDSFIKVNQKEYQEIKAGRKSLKSLGSSSPSHQQVMMGSPPAPRPPPSPPKRASGKAPRNKAIKKKKLSESDTDSCLLYTSPSPRDS